MTKGLSVDQAKKIREAKGLEETRLQKIRVKKGFSQDTLAALSGVTARMIRSYEQQSRPIDGARLETLCNLAFALDCRIEDILEDKTLIEKYKVVK